MDGFQHEQPDYWLNFGNPWEIERLNVGYPISFYGHVSVHEEEGRQVFRWNPGETVGLQMFLSALPSTSQHCVSSTSYIWTLKDPFSISRRILSHMVCFIYSCAKYLGIC